MVIDEQRQQRHDSYMVQRYTISTVYLIHQHIHALQYQYRVQISQKLRSMNTKPNITLGLYSIN